MCTLRHEPGIEWVFVICVSCNGMGNCRTVPNASVMSKNLACKNDGIVEFSHKAFGLSYEIPGASLFEFWTSSAK